MEVIVNKFYKTENGRIVVIVRDLGSFATRLMTKTTKDNATKEVVIEIVKDFYQEENLDIKFIDDPDCLEDVSISYYETCYGWEA